MQHFIYRNKRILRNPAALFWSMAFPLILGALFYFMFGNVDSVEQFSEVPVGVVEQQENSLFVEMMEEVEMEEDVPMFRVTTYDTLEAAEQALEKESISGIVLVEGQDISMEVKDSSTYTSLLKTFLDQYQQNVTLIEDMAATHPEQVAALVASLYDNEGVEILEISLKGQDKSPYTQYFYALLAMACLMASSLGVENGMDLQADQSALGARRNVAPTKKMHQVLIDFTADFVLYCVMMALVLAVLILVYKQDFGTNVALILLGTWVCSFVGLSGGTMMSVVLKGGRVAKNGVSVAFFMVSSFLGGLQWVDITYYLEKSCPIVNRINPATLMVNAFKSLAVFAVTVVVISARRKERA